MKEKTCAKIYNISFIFDYLTPTGFPGPMNEWTEACDHFLFTHQSPRQRTLRYRTIIISHEYRYITSHHHLSRLDSNTKTRLNIIHKKQWSKPIYNEQKMF